MTFAKIFLFIILIIIGATFCSLNRQDIILRYFFGWSIGPFPLFLLIIIFFLAGSAITLTLGWGERRRLKAEAKKLKQRIVDLQKEVEAQSLAEEGHEQNES